jgi:hypothetical protein
MHVDDKVIFLKNVNIGMEGDIGVISDIHGNEEDIFKRKPQYIIFLEKQNERARIPVEEMKAVCGLV